MAIPGLKIPIKADIDTFRQSINDAKSLSTTAADFFAKQWAKNKIKVAIDTPEFKKGVNDATSFLINEFQRIKPTIQALTQTATKESVEAGIKTASIFASPALRGAFQAFTAVGVPAVMGLAAALGPLAIAAGVTVESIKLLDDAFKAALLDIERMVSIAEKSANLNLSPSFFQEFLLESKKLKVSTDDLESALKSAFEATKEVSPIDLDKWETGKDKITDVETALRVYNETVAKAAGTHLQGLTLFRDASTQDAKIKAVLMAMTELDRIGHNLEALDLGTKMFGSSFVDNIRTGKTSAESMLDTLSRAKEADSGIFSDAMVTRAKAVDDEMKLASQHLSDELKPGFESLESSILTIESGWAKMVELMAEAVALSNKIPWEKIANAAAFMADPFGYLAGKATTAVKQMTGTYTAPPGPNMMGLLTGGDDAPPKLSRGPGPRPKLKPTDTSGSGGRDRFDSAVDSIEKRTAALKAEADTIDLGTQARERAKIVAQLETVAKQANAAAGEGENVITDEQRKKIDAVADAYGRAALKIEQAHSPLATFARESADLDAQLNKFAAGSLNNLTDDLAGIIEGTKSVSQAFSDMAKSIIDDLLKIAIRKSITGPIAGALFGGATGGGIFAGLFADGGMISGPGGPRDDRVPIMASNGEFIVNSASAKKFAPMLHAINSGSLSRFADGGMVGGSMPAIGGVGAPVVNSTIHVNVTTQGGGSKKENADLASQIGQQVQAAVDQRVAFNLRQAMRPGGMLTHR